MEDGVEVIVQGALSHDRWVGRADILRRVEGESRFGPWSYEVMDTKLARETKAGTVLQLCLYSEMLREAQGTAPEYMHVVVPWSDFEPQGYRFADYAAYFRQVQRGLLAAMGEQGATATYPEPVEHCDLCRWRETCDKRRRDDDHLCLVAGISKLQINELKQRGVANVAGPGPHAPAVGLEAGPRLPGSLRARPRAGTCPVRGPRDRREDLRAASGGGRFRPFTPPGTVGRRHLLRPGGAIRSWASTASNIFSATCRRVTPASPRTGASGRSREQKRSRPWRISSTLSWTAGNGSPACTSTTTLPTSRRP